MFSGMLGRLVAIDVEMEVVVTSTAPEPNGSGPRKVLISGEVAPSSRRARQSFEVRGRGEAANLSPGPPAAKNLSVDSGCFYTKSFSV
jgi:hypothetical protein